MPILCLCTMNTRDKILSRYEPQLASIAALDQAYYLKKVPSTNERSAYFARQEQRAAIRSQMYHELEAAETKKPPKRVTSSESCRIVLPDQTIHHLCQVKHDALNKLSVALGRTQLLSELVEKSPDASQHTTPIRQALEQMTKCLRQPCPFVATQALNKSPSNR